MKRQPAPHPDEPSHIQFVVHYPPTPKGRPRVVNGKAHTPATTAKAEVAIRRAALEMMRMAQGDLVPAMSGPLEVHIVGVMAHDQDDCDVDNVAKCVLDAIQKMRGGHRGVVFDDDAQVAHLVVSKCWHPDKPSGAIQVAISKLAGERFEHPSQPYWVRMTE